LLRAALAGLLLFTVESRSFATVLAPADLRDLAREARTIAHGTVSALEPRWTTDTRAIETLVTLEVTSYLKGPLTGVLRFRVPGGRIGRLRSVTIGAPQFVVGDEVVVFLGANGPSLPYILGLSQGLFRLVRQGAESMVIPQPVLPATRATRVVRGGSGRKAMPLEAFELRIRALAAAGPMNVRP
jgi:hypothetical protein